MRIHSGSDRCRYKAKLSKKRAKAKAHALTKRTGEQIDAYKCKDGCHAWHVGHRERYRDRERRYIGEP